MTKYEVSVLEPGITNSNRDDDPRHNRYAANVHVKPPFEAGPALGKFLSGNDYDYSGVSVAEVASTEKGSHLLIATAVGQAATAEARTDRPAP